MMKHARWLGVAVAVAVIATGCAITPGYPPSSAAFEGFPVNSFVPANPRGVVFMFHGTNGRADFSEKLESVDMLNHLVLDGYGFVSTESTDRTERRWNNVDLSLTGNLDLARLQRLYLSMIADGRMTSATPIYAIGMSEGAGFASVFARSFKDAGYPVAAIAPSHGPIPVAVRNRGGLTVPAIFALGANDPIVNNSAVINQVFQVGQTGVPVAAYVEPETALTSARLLRVPGIDGATAGAIVAALVSAGLYDASGHRVASTGAVDAALPTLALPASVSADQRKMIIDEVEVVMAVHNYSATYWSQTIAFFDAHR
jgi:poly(3-hydroxybutyrate) depolymerase